MLASESGEPRDLLEFAGLLLPKPPECGFDRAFRRYAEDLPAEGVRLGQDHVEVVDRPQQALKGVEALGCSFRRLRRQRKRTSAT